MSQANDEVEHHVVSAADPHPLINGLKARSGTVVMAATN